MSSLPDPIILTSRATRETFSEAAYLRANPDVAEAVLRGDLASGAAHFAQHGVNETRYQSFDADLAVARAEKLRRLAPFIRTDMAWQPRDGKMDFLTPAMRQEGRIADTANVASSGYDHAVKEMMARHAGGLILDCGAGLRHAYYRDVVNFEIVDYPTTDVLGIGEQLPFVDGTFDAVISIAVLEHVRDPIRCAAEISRVLKKGGELFCSIPFLQPLHGYPHHYFNATPQGIRRLFEDALQVQSVEVFPSTHPIHALYWILKSWNEGLAPDVAIRFRAMTIADLLRDPFVHVREPFCATLPADKQLELACATVLTAVK